MSNLVYTSFNVLYIGQSVQTGAGKDGEASTPFMARIQPSIIKTTFMYPLFGILANKCFQTAYANLKRKKDT